MSIERNPIARAAKSVFYEDFNDLDVYIEDTAPGYEKLFTILLTRVFQGLYKVNNVFPIGERQAVVERFNAHINIGRPSIFIIDGDLFLLTGEGVDSAPGLYKLPFYCIENILCDFDAMLDLLNEEDHIRSKREISELLNFDSWKNDNEGKLFDLFIIYAVTFKHRPSIQTVAYPVRNIIQSRQGDVCPVKLESRMSLLEQTVTGEIGGQQYMESKNAIIEHVKSISLGRLDIVSGKDYLFPLLKLRAKSVVKTKISDINFKQRLSRKCDLTKLQPIKGFVLK